jgi:hypothetical protein
VSGDLSRNWGETPVDLRPLFMLMEETSRIVGAARIFAVIAYRESAFVTTAHNGNAAERAGRARQLARAYANNKAATRRCDTASRRPSSAAAACSALLAPVLPVDRRPRGREPRRRC